MGLEALTPVAVRRILDAEGLTRDSLAAKWSVESERLDAEVRKRILLSGDAEAYRRARLASDGFEHGYLGFEEVYDHAYAVHQTVAGHFRRRILEELGLGSSDAALLASAPYDQPAHIHSAKYLRGQIVAASDEVAQAGQAYPYIQWRTKFREVDNPSSDLVEFTVDETITPLLADGVSFKPNRIEAWGGAESVFGGNRA